MQKDKLAKETDPSSFSFPCAYRILQIVLQLWGKKRVFIYISRFYADLSAQFVLSCCDVLRCQKTGKQPPSLFLSVLEMLQGNGLQQSEQLDVLVQMHSQAT